VLSAARERGVLVLVLLGGVVDAEEASLAAAEDCASVVRVWAERGHQFTATVDGDAAAVGDANLLHGEHRTDDHALLVENSRKLAWAVESLTGNFWAAADEAFVRDPVALPASFRSFRHAVVQATLHRRAGTPVRVEASVAGDAGGTVTGRVLDVNQTVLDPTTGDIGIENGLAVETTDDDVVTVGGTGAFLEDVEATAVRLLPAE
jgi:hypothetical protein